MQPPRWIGFGLVAAVARAQLRYFAAHGTDCGKMFARRLVRLPEMVDRGFGLASHFFKFVA
jgi:hypothetical protein